MTNLQTKLELSTASIFEYDLGLYSGQTQYNAHVYRPVLWSHKKRRIIILSRCCLMFIANCKLYSTRITYNL